VACGPPRVRQPSGGASPSTQPGDLSHENYANMIIRVAVALLVVSGTVVQAQEPVIGLLSIPELFGSEPCDRFEPADIPLYAEPAAEARIGLLRVDGYGVFHEAGGCEALVVNAHLSALEDPVVLPTLEYGYETPGAIVLRRHGSWYKVRLPSGAAWFHSSPRAEYHPVEQLLLNGLTYLTDGFGGNLAASAGGVAGSAGSDRPKRGDSVKVIDFSRAGDQLWVQVQLLSDSPCESAEEPTVVLEGWTRAHNESGEPTVWFYSRGC
jgi:hypothetical protein